MTILRFFENRAPDTKSNPKQDAIVNIELNIVACPTYPDKFILDNVVAPSVATSVVTVTLPSLNVVIALSVSWRYTRETNEIKKIQPKTTKSVE